jgi:methionyl-tRNA formyltransferase
MTNRIVFMGSPEFSVPILKALGQNYRVVGVITQPDKPAGRGRILTPPPVKVCAQSLNIEVIQPNRLREPDALAKLESWAPDLIVVAAFGQILRQNVLDLPQYGCVNVHASLLPRWRGAAPIQAAILHNDPKTGITIMKMDAGIDTGAMLSQEEMMIEPEDTAQSLGVRLAEAGADLLLKTLPVYLSGKITPIPQEESKSTYAPMLKKEEGLLDFSQPAADLVCKVRAFNPWPGAYTIWNNEMLKIHRAHASAISSSVGTRTIIDKMPAIGASSGWLILDEVQPAGKKSMPGKIFLQGARNWSAT